MDKLEYEAPTCYCIKIMNESAFLTGSNIDNPGIGGPGDIPIE